MRVIKFRIWEEEHKRFLYRGLTDRNWHATPYNDANGCNCVRGAVPEDALRPIEQYIGRSDKNGQEIYEGDIVFQVFEISRQDGIGNPDLEIYGSHQGIVRIYVTKGAVISPCYTEFDEEITSEKAYQKPRVQYGVKVSKRCRVLGNIHQNPEFIITSKMIEGK